MPSNRLIPGIILLIYAGFKGFAVPEPDLPDASFTSNETLITRQGCIRFFDESTGNPLTWHWIFEGAVPSESSEQNPVVIYPSAGQYDVILIVSNQYGTDTLVIENYSTVTMYPQGWEFTPTLNSHVISVPVSALPAINTDALLPGDLVGVFFTTGPDTLCGGFSEWDGQENIAVIAFGDDPYSSGKDGFAYGEEFIWQIFSWCIREQYLASAGYSFGTSYFVPGGLSALNSLNASGPVFYQISGHVEDESGSDLGQVFLSYGPDICPVLSDTWGNYIRSVPSDWSDTVKPFLQGYLFDPEWRAYADVTSHHTGQDYLASPDNGPPGWDFTVTPISHSFVVPLNVSPTVNDNSLITGDFIGVFYIDTLTGQEICGGYEEWSETLGTIITGFGDDPSTSEKEGFATDEQVRWKVYQVIDETASDAIAVYDPAYPRFNGLFYPAGSSGLTDLYADSLTVVATALDDTLCLGQVLQLNASVSGGSGIYTYSWSSIPPGFVSSEENPQLVPQISGDYVLSVTTLNDTVTDTVSVLVFPYPEVSAGNDTLIELYDTLMLQGQVNWNGVDAGEVLWSPSQFLSSSQINNPLAFPDSTSTLTITAINMAGCQDNDSMIITVIPPGWNTLPTDVNHLFHIPFSASVTIDSITLDNGDYIAVFYHVNDSELCAGYTIWNGMSDAMITAFGDDPATGVKEGFGDNERINWKIYSWNLKSEHIAIPSYDPDFPDYDGKFSAGGSSSLTELSGLSLLKNQVLQLSQNWSGISSYIEPVDALVESLFEPVVDDMVVLQQQNLVYWPAFDINTIVYWDAHKGYIVKMTDPQYLFLTGWEVSDKNIDLSPGWCDIPVLSSTEVLSDVVFGPLGDDLVVATEIAGSKVYWPAMGIFSLDTLQPGKSYYVFLNNAVTIIFP